MSFGKISKKKIKPSDQINIKDSINPASFKAVKSLPSYLQEKVESN